MLATELHGHLDDLSGSLMQMIDAVNALSLPAGGSGQAQESGEDPMAQIAQILSSHLESLQWIDGAVRTHVHSACLYICGPDGARRSIFLGVI